MNHLSQGWESSVLGLLTCPLIAELGCSGDPHLPHRVAVCTGLAHGILLPP